MNEERSEWFPARTVPELVGEYEVRWSENDPLKPFRRKWTGSAWVCVGAQAGVWSAVNGSRLAQWRGLAVKS